MNETMLVLNLDPRLEEDLVDYLLAIDSISGFTIYHVSGHGDHANMNIAEQVSGQRKRLQVEIILIEDTIPDVLSGLASSVGKGITYWQQLIKNHGEIT